MADISSLAKRERLAVRREPHWQKIDSGAYLGFRKTGSGGTWLVRVYQPAAEIKQVHKSLGDFAAHPPGERYATALKEARSWLSHIGAGGRTEDITVYGCCARYVESVPKPAKRKELADRLLRILEFGGHNLGDVPLTKLTRTHLKTWRTSAAAQPALVSRKKDGSVTQRPRSDATLNRDMAPLRAALNYGLAHGYVTSDLTWRGALKPIAGAGRRRDVYLDRSQRTALVEKLPANLAMFVRGLCLLPLRPGALAALTVSSFDPRTSELRIQADKTGVARILLMPRAHSDFLQALAAGRSADAPLFEAPSGIHWNKDAWKKPIKAAAKASSLSDKVTAYTFRHSTITDLVTSGLDLFSVAQISGTSVAMIEKHYGHLQREHAAAALAKLA